MTATAQWDVARLEDGTIIPPHGEIDAFVAIRQNGAWRIAALNIHNRCCRAASALASAFRAVAETPAL